MMSQHLSQTQLAAYSDRTLFPDELLAVDSHLASCDVCHERLIGITPAVAKLTASGVYESGEGTFHLDYDQHLEPYVDGKANEIEREIVDSHIALCSECATDLRDLLEFKQQPVVATNTVTRSSSWWKQWFTCWPLQSHPALATAVVIAAVFVVLSAVVLWTIYPTSQQVKQVEVRQPAAGETNQGAANEQPSPEPTEHAAQGNQSPGNGTSQPGPPREQPLIVLNDAGGQLTMNQRGQLEGLDELPPDLRESVERALATRRLRASPGLTGWTTGAGNLRSEFETQSTFAPLAPTDVVLESDRPTFRWQTLDSAQDYTVTIYDANLRQVATSGPVTSRDWTTPTPLARGVTYSWQISALKDGKRVVSPKPPLPEARFRILDQPALVSLTKLRESAGNSHLVMGVFYWKHGLIEDAQREFQALAKANPNSPAVKALLVNIRSMVTSHRRP